MSEKLLSHIIKKDRKSVGITQADLQAQVEELAKSENTFVASRLISNIERGVARIVLKADRSLIARSLGKDGDEYFGVEINPMNFVNRESSNNKVNENSWFDRSIEFGPEYRQAGVSILSFFAEVVRSEYSDQNVKIGILQDGETVTLRVETPEGKLLKEIDKTLEKYGLVVMGSIPVESLSENKELIRDLKTKLEVTNLELRLRQENHLEQQKQYEGRVLNLEDQVKNLHEMIGSNLAHHTQLADMIKSIISDDKVSNSLQSAIDTINKLATSEYSEDSAKKIEESISLIENRSPGFVRRLATTLETVPASILSNLALPWMQSILIALPK